MATEGVNEGKCFTFIWKIENASYCWQMTDKGLESPSFVVNELEESKWSLNLYPDTSSFRNNRKVTVVLFRKLDGKDAEKRIIEWQFDLLTSNGAVLLSSSLDKNDTLKGIRRFSRTCQLKRGCFARSEFQPPDTLIIRCRIWKTVGEFSENIQRIARTCIRVKKLPFLWEVGNFSTLEGRKEYTYVIKSLDTSEELMHLKLFFTQIFNSEEIVFGITQKNTNIKFCTIELSTLDAFGAPNQTLKGEFLFVSLDRMEQLSTCLSKAEIMQENEVLSLRGKLCFSTGIAQEETEIKTVDTILENSELENPNLSRENLKRVLNDDLKSMLNDRIHSDIQLKTSSKTYPAHKCILSARSPVFKAMFSHDMNEEIKEAVDIDDLNDDTVSSMLQYMYSAEVEELDWDSATQLYAASDKYEILLLKNVCSSYLKKHLCPKNACDALVLADLHQDEDLKSFVQNFIVKQGKFTIHSGEWEQLMKTNIHLEADIMREKFKE